MSRISDIFEHELIIYIFVTKWETGIMLQRRGEHLEALCCFSNALLMEPGHVSSKIYIGAILTKLGGSMLPIARCLLSDAVRTEPTNRMAWFHLGLVHKNDGLIADAAECFQTASVLEESDPVEAFSSVL